MGILTHIQVQAYGGTERTIERCAALGIHQGIARRHTAACIGERRMNIPPTKGIHGKWVAEAELHPGSLPKARLDEKGKIRVPKLGQRGIQEHIRAVPSRGGGR
ncbi:hypothetical protein SDC9_106615 [bioreactor metagenome]|uniref:Uncharacterized protein n=1 Tax=bioreactor metagenome TaxID=1076179 RepID=A0A645B2X4_9ZZZZ